MQAAAEPSPPTGSSPSLEALIRGGESIDVIAAHLDAMSPEGQASAANALGRKDQARLFEKAGDGPVIGLDHFVPAALPARTAVHHPGRNTVPVPRFFQRFEKRFARSAEDPRRLFGYNFSNARFIRPGYFVAHATAGHAVWEKRGGVVVDYFRVPDGAVPDGWPVVVPNCDGVQRLVYDKTRDFMRSVSSRVSIGRAATEDRKGDRELDFWFTLVREGEL